MTRLQIIPEGEAPDMTCQACLSITITGTSDDIGRTMDVITAQPGVAITVEPEGWTDKTFYGWERSQAVWETGATDGQG